MSDKQIALIFAKLDEVLDQLEGMRKVVSVLHEKTTIAVANSEIVLDGYHRYGTEIEHLRLMMEKLRLRCPLLRPKTGEVEKLACGED